VASADTTLYDNSVVASAASTTGNGMCRLKIASYKVYWFPPTTFF
jgi:hypothetical protein